MTKACIGHIVQPECYRVQIHMLLVLQDVLVNYKYFRLATVDYQSEILGLVFISISICYCANIFNKLTYIVTI